MSAVSHHDETRGAALLMCLLLLTALSLLGLAAATDARLQQRMAGNSESARESRRRAESALAWAEAWLFSRDGSQAPENCEPPCGAGDVIWSSAGHFPRPEHRPTSWWLEYAHLAGTDPADGRLVDHRLAASHGRWLVEELHRETAVPDDGVPATVAYYRLTARAAGPRESVVTVVESILARPWGNEHWTAALPAGSSVQALCRSFEPDLSCGRLAWRRLR
jgi:Tfp pilus assembly protein PilX